MSEESKVQSKAAQLKAMISMEATEPVIDERTAFERMVDTISELAAQGGWEVDPDREEQMFIMTMSNGSKKVSMIWDLEEQEFVSAVMTKEIRNLSGVIEALS